MKIGKGPLGAAIALTVLATGGAAHDRDFKHAHIDVPEGGNHTKPQTPHSDFNRVNSKRMLRDWIARFGENKVHWTSEPDRGRNCHGLTFDQGESWIDEVEPFVDQCEAVDEGDAQVGDVVVYRLDGEIMHTGRIKSIDNDTIIVCSQFGDLGDAAHEIDKVFGGESWRFVLSNGKTEPDAGVIDYGSPQVMRCELELGEVDCDNE